jgi:hypothetical protein
MSFVVVALWNLFSIWSISHISAFRCRSSSTAELALDLVQAASEMTRTPSALAIKSLRI